MGRPCTYPYALKGSVMEGLPSRGDEDIVLNLRTNIGIVANDLSQACVSLHAIAFLTA